MPRNAISAGCVAVTNPLPEALRSIGFVTGVAGSMAGIAFCDYWLSDSRAEIPYRLNTGARAHFTPMN
jgi:hypothetical protein